MWSCAFVEQRGNEHSSKFTNNLITSVELLWFSKIYTEIWHIHTYSTDNVIKSFHKDVLFYVLLYFNNQQTPSQTKAFLCACGLVCVSVSSKFPPFCVTGIDPAVSLSLASVRTCSLAWKSFELSQVELMAAYHKIPRPRVWRPILKHHTKTSVHTH